MPNSQIGSRLELVRLSGSNADFETGFLEWRAFEPGEIRTVVEHPWSVPNEAGKPELTSVCRMRAEQASGRMLLETSERQGDNR